MLKNILTLVLLFGAWSCSSRGAVALEAPWDGELVYLDSARGQELLYGCRTKGDFVPLVTALETQDNLTYCGVASSVTVLNALPLVRPFSPEHGSFGFFQQETFFDKEASRVVPEAAVRERGMTLQELSDLLRTKGLQVETRHGTDVSLEAFRTQLRTALEEADRYVLLNYLRRSIGQETGGHISPVAAYHGPTDSFLVLDVAAFKYPPAWVTAPDLWAAIQGIDSDSGRSRGFAIVSLSASASLRD